MTLHPLIPDMWSRITREHAVATAHNRPYTGRHSFEAILASWCRIKPEMRGRLADLLIAVWEQERQREDDKLQTASYRVERAIWPLFLARTHPDDIIAAAQQANRGALTPQELDKAISITCERAIRPPYKKAYGPRRS